MRQYQYQMIEKSNGRIEHARATAQNADIARAQIVLFYGSQFEIMGLFSDVNPPHYILGEIDCSDFPVSDTEWLMRQIKA